MHILLSVLKYRPDDGHAHLEIFSTVHAAFEQGKSLGLQLNMTRSAEDWSACGAKHKVDKNYKKHKGIKETEKIEYIAALAEKHSSRYFVETGTWYGETINAVKGQFEKLVSIEISAQLSEYASRRFSNDPHIQILNVRIPSISCSSCFHYEPGASNGTWPISALIYYFPDFLFNRGIVWRFSQMC